MPIQITTQDFNRIQKNHNSAALSLTNSKIENYSLTDTGFSDVSCYGVDHKKVQKNLIKITQYNASSCRFVGFYCFFFVWLCCGCSMMFCVCLGEERLNNDIENVIYIRVGWMC